MPVGNGVRRPATLEIDAAERLCEMLGWAEQVRFGSSGTEMVQAALRVARAATGRRRFVRFEGHYHGWLDNVLIAVGGEGAGPASAGQLAESLDESITLPWNDLDTVDGAFDRHGGDIAAVLMEPVMFNAGVDLAVRTRQRSVQYRVISWGQAAGSAVPLDGFLCRGVRGVVVSPRCD